RQRVALSCHSPRIASFWPSSTFCFSCTRIAATVPSRGAVTGISIFIASSMIKISPSCTRSPVATSIFNTTALSSENTDVSAISENLSGTHGERAGAGANKLVGEPRELAQQRAALARIDDLLDPERLGGAERRPQLVQALLDLGELGDRIRCGIDVCPIGCLDAALERQRAPVAGRPRIAQRQPAGRLVHGSGDAETIAHDDGAPRHGGLVDRRHRAHAMTDGGGALGLDADEKAGTVHEIDDRQMKSLRQVDEAHDLLARGGGPGAAV